MPGVILVVPPWPRSGSGNIFASQAAAHIALGRAVFILIGPYEAWHRVANEVFWHGVKAGMAFADVQGTAAGISRDSMKPWRSKSFFQWRWAGRDDALAIAARYAQAAVIPPEVHAFIRDHRIEFVHVNHMFEMGLGAKVADLVASATGLRPVLICETHDIQTDQHIASGKVNPFSHMPDARPALLESELKWLRKADILTHCSPADHDFFSLRLPDHQHAILLPSIMPELERTLRAQRHVKAAVGYDFIYIGNSHHGNAVTIVWMIENVLPLVSDCGFKIAVIGRVVELVKLHFPDLYKKYAELFLGEVMELAPFYLKTRAVLTPAIEGTGSSIKLIEALCAGKPQITTSHALRGLPPELSLSEDLSLKDLSSKDLAVCKTPEAFAAAMRRFANAPSFSSAAAKLYDIYFDSKGYEKRLCSILSGSSPQHGA